MRLKLQRTAIKTRDIPRYALLKRLTLSIVIMLTMIVLSCFAVKAMLYGRNEKKNKYLNYNREHLGLKKVGYFLTF